MKTEPIKILICSGHALYRQYLAMAIESHSKRFQISAIVEEFEQAQYIIQNERIDYMLIRINSSEKKPFEFVSNFKKYYPNTKLIVLTFWDQPSFNNELVKSGAYAYYVINSKIETLMEKLESTG